jgi:hypothetical protein
VVPRLGGNREVQAIRNSVIHYLRVPDGKITAVERCLTDGSGSGAFNYRSEPIGILTEGAQSVLLTPNLRFLFAVNAGDNSVSGFGVGEDGTLTLLDVKRTGNIVTGRGGTAKSLAYAPSSGTLYVPPGDGTFRGLGGIVGSSPNDITSTSTLIPGGLTRDRVRTGSRDLEARRSRRRRPPAGTSGHGTAVSLQEQEQAGRGVLFSRDTRVSMMPGRGP